MEVVIKTRCVSKKECLYLDSHRDKNTMTTIELCAFGASRGGNIFFNVLDKTEADKFILEGYYDVTVTKSLDK